METNAAKELLALVDAWSASGSVGANRDKTDPSGRPLWVAQHRAVRLLADVEDFIATQEDVEEYGPLVAELREFVFASSGSWWNTGASLDSRDRMQLKLLAQLMERSPFAVSIDAGGMDAAKQALEEALGIIESQEGVLEERLQYVAHLIARCLELIEDDTPDLLRLKSLGFEIAGEMVGVPASAMAEKDRQRFTNALRTFVVAFVTPAGAGIVANLATFGIQGHLGS